MAERLQKEQPGTRGRLRIAVLFHRLGPYHHARLNAAARIMDVVAIEFSGVDETYAWDKVISRSAFAQRTLFANADIDSLPAWKIAPRVIRALRDAAPDVIAVPGWSDRAALIALGWCRANGVPAIVMSASTARDAERGPFKEAIKRLIVGQFSGAIAGGTAQSEYLNDLNMKRSRIFLGYDVVDNDYFSAAADSVRKRAGELRRNLNLPENFFIMSARFVPKKNLLGALAAFADYRRRASRDEWSLVLLGDGPMKQQISDFVASNGLRDAVLMPGFKQYNELPTYYGLAGAFVLSSTVEQWGLVVNEAMASGLPVIVSKHCGCVEDLVAEGRNGLTFDPDDHQRLADLLLYVASDPELRYTMGREGRRIIGNWSPETFANALFSAARQATSPRGRVTAQ